MLRDHLVGDEDVADKQYVFRRKQHISASRHLRRYRVCALLVLFGLHLLATRPGAGNSHTLTPQQAAPTHMSIQTAQASAFRAPLSVGMGVGASTSERTSSTLPAASCNPFDVICWLTNAAQWTGQQIINTLQSVINGLLHGPLDIIAQRLDPPSSGLVALPAEERSRVNPWRLPWRDLATERACHLREVLKSLPREAIPPVLQLEDAEEDSHARGETTALTSHPSRPGRLIVGDLVHRAAHPLQHEQKETTGDRPAGTVPDRMSLEHPASVAGTPTAL